MKKITCLFMLCLPFFVHAQEETTHRNNTLSIALEYYFANPIGYSVDYRRNLTQNVDFNIGYQSNQNSYKSAFAGLNVYFYQDRNVFLSIGFESGLTFFDHTLNGENRKSMPFVRPKLGAFYKATPGVELFGEYGFNVGTYLPDDQEFPIDGISIKAGARFRF